MKSKIKVKKDSEATSAVSTIFCEVENALVNSVPLKEVQEQIDTLQEKGKFPSNLQLLDAFYDSKSSSSCFAIL